MHAVLEDIVHMAVLQPVADAAGVALRSALAAIGDADLVEIAHQVACRSIQAPLMVSHISLVSAVRTERELSLAFSMQFLIEDGLEGANDRYSTTLRSSASS